MNTANHSKFCSQEQKSSLAEGDQDGTKIMHFACKNAEQIWAHGQNERVNLAVIVA